MSGVSGHERLSFLGRRLPAAFAVRVLTVPPGRTRAYERADWQDAIVVVEHGQIELEHLDGSRGRFGLGAVLWLAGLPLRAIHNRWAEPALLVAVSRQRQEAEPGG
jgi:hypothetical protein